MSRHALRDFIAHHDDRWLFVAVYIGLAVVLSIMLSLFWLVAVAALHFSLEYLRQAQFQTGRLDIVTHALWEVKLDVALVLLALAMALYMELILGVLGLQSAARATAASRAGMRATRFFAWERNLRAFMLMADDVAVGALRLFRRRGRPAPDRIPQAGAAAVAVAETDVVHAVAGADTAAVAVAVPGSWRNRWSFGDRLTVCLLVSGVLLIVLAPVLTPHSWGGATIALLEQLHPFPAR
jgi:hypothetical protein